MIIFNIDKLGAGFLSFLILFSVAGAGLAYFFDFLHDYINKKKK